MKNENLKTGLFLIAAVLLSLIATLFLLTSCSPPNDASTAGVLTETESGRTLAFSIESEVGEYSAQKSARVKFALTKIVEGKTELLDSATVDYGDYAVFEDVKGAYSVVATAAGLNGDEKGDSDTLFGAEILKRNDLDTVYVRVGEPATLKISTTYTGDEQEDFVSEGDTLCITGTLACTEISETDIKRGYSFLNNIPIIDNESVVKQIEIRNGDDFRIVGVEWQFLQGDTLFASENAVTKHNILGIDITLPESALFDTLGDRTLDSLIVPVKWFSEDAPYFSQYFHFFLDEQGDVITAQGVKEQSDTFIWIVVPKIDSAITLTAVEGEYKYEALTRTRLWLYREKAYEDTLTVWNIFKDSSFAVSFWFELDSLADSTVLLGSCSGPGFEIRRCQKDSSAVCTRIYSGSDSTSSEFSEYGKANLVDGKRHHYSLVIHKKHLTVAVDGTTIRDTDLKPAENFYSTEGIRATPGIAEDILVYSFGDYIKHKGDKDWTRLKAWLYSLYEMQREVGP